MWENWGMRWAENDTTSELWGIRWSIDSDQSEKISQKQEAIDYLLEQFQNLDLQTEDILDGIIEIRADIESARKANPNNPVYQDDLNKISLKVDILIQKRKYISTIMHRIESISVDYHTWKMSKQQEAFIHDIRLRIFEAKNNYPDDAIFISILSRLELKLNKLFSI